MWNGPMASSTFYGIDLSFDFGSPCSRRVGSNTAPDGHHPLTFHLLAHQPFQRGEAINNA